MAVRERFQVVPAVDLVGEEAVRLRQGEFASVVAHAGDPGELVARWAAARPPLVHVVDLDGARSGRVRPELIRRLAEIAAPVPVQASGGIRSLADAEALLDAGAARVVAGTATLSSPGALAELVEALGERLVVAVDARGGKVAVAGWTEEADVGPEDFAARCAAAGVARLLCTAIDRDGTMGGPDLGLLERVRDSSGLPILAAGGIRSEADLDALAASGLEGAVVGRALLEGAIRL
ncbi:MAG TPA: 1-(5-phosphoribosyl)-5-[(5-phosphoribosylamino)methylideneamino] imidazole-4-carboxamide isomerase [Gaiellaceae bacterium]|nr:1-(5-phosphoribosyl)-5-[(5-phosphoribosylamino)methylideneamino] imidazole-4-carboxamide isomerase [Gaiellaceae bacterium]